MLSTKTYLKERSNELFSFIQKESLPFCRHKFQEFEKSRISLIVSWKKWQFLEKRMRKQINYKFCKLMIQMKSFNE